MDDADDFLGLNGSIDKPRRGRRGRLDAFEELMDGRVDDDNSSTSSDPTEDDEIPRKVEFADALSGHDVQQENTDEPGSPNKADPTELQKEKAEENEDNGNTKAQEGGVSRSGTNQSEDDADFYSLDHEQKTFSKEIPFSPEQTWDFSLQNLMEGYKSKCLWLEGSFYQAFKGECLHEMHHVTCDCEEKKKLPVCRLCQQVFCSNKCFKRVREKLEKNSADHSKEQVPTETTEIDETEKPVGATAAAVNPGEKPPRQQHDYKGRPDFESRKGMVHPQNEQQKRNQQPQQQPRHQFGKQNRPSRNNFHNQNQFGNDNQKQSFHNHGGKNLPPPNLWPQQIRARQQNNYQQPNPPQPAMPFHAPQFPRAAPPFPGTSAAPAPRAQLQGYVQQPNTFDNTNAPHNHASLLGSPPRLNASPQGTNNQLMEIINNATSKLTLKQNNAPPGGYVPNNIGSTPEQPHIPLPPNKPDGPRKNEAPVQIPRNPMPDRHLDSRLSDAAAKNQNSSVQRGPTTPFGQSTQQPTNESRRPHKDENIRMPQHHPNQAMNSFNQNEGNFRKYTSDVRDSRDLNRDQRNYGNCQSENEGFHQRRPNHQFGRKENSRRMKREKQNFKQSQSHSSAESTPSFGTARDNMGDYHNRNVDGNSSRPGLSMDSRNNGVATTNIRSSDSVKGAESSTKSPQTMVNNFATSPNVKVSMTKAKTHIVDNPPDFPVGILMPVKYVSGETFHDFTVMTLKNLEAFEALQQGLQSCPKSKLGAVQTGDYCMTKYASRSGNGEEWYRGIVIKVLPQIFVFLLDYGFTVKVPQSSVNDLPDEYKSYRPLAIRMETLNLRLEPEEEVDAQQYFDSLVRGLSVKIRITHKIATEDYKFAGDLEVMHLNKWHDVGDHLQTLLVGSKPSVDDIKMEENQGRIVALKYSSVDSNCVDLLSANRREFAVKLTHVVSLNEFYVLTKESIQRKTRFERELNSVPNITDTLETPKSMEDLTCPCFAMFDEDSDGWLRVAVLEVARADAENVTVIVFKMDSGERQTVPISSLRMIPDTMRGRASVYKCSLPVKPWRKNRSNVVNDLAVDFLRERLEQRSSAVVLSSVPQPGRVILVELFFGNEENGCTSNFLKQGLVQLSHNLDLSRPSRNPNLPV